MFTLQNSSVRNQKFSTLRDPIPRTTGVQITIRVMPLDPSVVITNLPVVSYIGSGENQENVLIMSYSSADSSFAIRRDFLPGTAKEHSAGEEIGAFAIGVAATEGYYSGLQVSQVSQFRYLEEVIRAMNGTESPWIKNLWEDTKLLVTSATPPSNLVRVLPGGYIVSRADGTAKTLILGPGDDSVVNTVEVKMPDRGYKAMALVFITWDGVLGMVVGPSVRSNPPILVAPTSSARLLAELTLDGTKGVINTGDIKDLRDL